MTNHWGRGGETTAAQGASAGTVVFACLVSLLVGGAGGYGAFRVLSPAVAPGAIEARDARIDSLTRDLAAQAEADRTGADALVTENAGLKRQIEALRTTADAPDEMKRLSQQLADADAFRTRAEESVRDRERQLSLKADQIAALEKALHETRRDREASGNAEAAKLRQQLKAAKQAEEQARAVDLPALRQEIARKDTEIATLSAQARALSERIATLEAAAQSNEGKAPAAGNVTPDSRRSPRNAGLVARALGDTPGLERLSGAERDRLEETLVSGECVTNALSAAFSRVPVLTLRNLMRDLASDC